MHDADEESDVLAALGSLANAAGCVAYAAYVIPRYWSECAMRLTTCAVRLTATHTSQ